MTHDTADDELECVRCKIPSNLRETENKLLFDN